MQKAVKSDIYHLLCRQSDALDRLCQDAMKPMCHVGDYDALESRAQDIAKALVAAFRGGDGAK